MSESKVPKYETLVKTGSIDYNWNRPGLQEWREEKTRLGIAKDEAEKRARERQELDRVKMPNTNVFSSVPRVPLVWTEHKRQGRVDYDLTAPDMKKFLETAGAFNVAANRNDAARRNRPKAKKKREAELSGLPTGDDAKKKKQG